jgi:hypothetical protein
LNFPHANRMTQGIDLQIEFIDHFKNIDLLDWLVNIADIRS